MPNGHSTVKEVMDAVNKLTVDVAKIDTKLDSIEVKMDDGRRRMDRMQDQINEVKRDLSGIKQVQARHAVVYGIGIAIITGVLVFLGRGL